MYTTSILKIYILTQSNISIEIHYIIRTLTKHLIILYNFNNNNNNNIIKIRRRFYIFYTLLPRNFTRNCRCLVPIMI